jgi:hypothetical protein
MAKWKDYPKVIRDINRESAKIAGKIGITYAATGKSAMERYYFIVGAQQAMKKRK